MRGSTASFALLCYLTRDPSPQSCCLSQFLSQPRGFHKHGRLHIHDVTQVLDQCSNIDLTAFVDVAVDGDELVRNGAILSCRGVGGDGPARELAGSGVGAETCI